MKGLLAIFIFIVCSFVGCACVIVILVVSKLLPNPLVDMGYGIIAPMVLGLCLAVTAIPFALMASRIGSLKHLILVGFIEGILTPLISIVLLFVPWEVVIPRGTFIIPALLGCIISFLVAYLCVNLIKKHIQGSASLTS